MSGLIHATQPRTFLVTFDTLPFYATRWKLHGERSYAEQGGTTGVCFLTNSCVHAKRLVLSGYFPAYDSPSAVVLALESAISNQTRFTFTLRGMRFSVVMITAYTLEEAAADGVLPCQLTLVTTNGIAEVEEETETST